MLDFAAALTGLKFAKEALSFTLKQKIDAEVQEKVSEALEKLGSVQDDLYILREELLKIQEENHGLKELLREKESWDGKMSNYILVSTESGGTIYKSILEPEHFICPACTEKKEIHILQSTSSKKILLTCPACKTNYYNKPTPAISYGKF